MFDDDDDDSEKDFYPAVGGVPAGKPGSPSGTPGKPAFPGFIYNGGPVIASPVIYTSFWGTLWSDAAHQAAAQRLNQYVADLLASGFMNILSQYGASKGAGTSKFVKGFFVSSVENQLTDAEIQQHIQQAINGGELPEPLPNNTSLALLIYLDENTEVYDSTLGIVMCEPQGDTAFGYHSHMKTAAGNPMYYCVIPALTDECLKETCGTGPCSLSLSQTQEQRRTQVTSHEFAEMLTDPVPPTGWFDKTDPNSDELADICNGEAATITGPSGIVWTVQRLYSASDDQKSGGTSYCLATADSPVPVLSKGPTSGGAGSSSSTSTAKK